ncbi:restriction endonuclease [Streptomyces viridosporus]|uniref:restriction endonuclease n=1 Tax=Streptomyces viridosporus TaxID=67581 RepID=UPI0037003ABC
MSLLEPSADSVRPSPEHAVRRVLELALEQATSVDLEAAFAWMTEGRLADELLADWRGLGEEMKAELTRCQNAIRTLKDVTAPQDTMRYGRCAAEMILESDLKGLVSLADKAVQWCEQARHDVITDLGRLIRERRTQFPSAKAAPLGELLEELKQARARYACSLETYREELQQLSAEEQQRQEYLRSSDSISLHQIRNLSDRQFELLIASLLERDGYEVQRAHGGAGDRGADVIATGGNGERIVVQCKLRRTPSAKIGSPEVQMFNGTARPDHRATHPLMVTNTRFTQDAEAAAARYGITLVDSTALRTWATFGKPLELG